MIVVAKGYGKRDLPGRYKLGDGIPSFRHGPGDDVSGKNHHIRHLGIQHPGDQQQRRIRFSIPVLVMHVGELYNLKVSLFVE